MNDVEVRELADQDLDKAEHIMRLAFGTFLGLQDPDQMFGDRGMISNRRYGNGSKVFGAYAGGELAGTNVVSRWGTFGWFGPLTVRPDLWDKGVAKKLMEPTMEQFSKWKTTHEGLFTFAHSQKHVGLYLKFGFYPHFLTAIMVKKKKAGDRDSSHQEEYETFSGLESGKERGDALGKCRELTNVIYGGLDLSDEIEGVQKLKLGDTIILRDGSRISGFAVCHAGPKTEAGSGSCYVKFGAADSKLAFRRLLDACANFAFDEMRVETLEAGVNLARSEAYREMLSHGFRTEFQGVAMQRPASESGFNREDVFAIDDWR